MYPSLSISKIQCSLKVLFYEALIKRLTIKNVCIYSSIVTVLLLCGKAGKLESFDRVPNARFSP